MTTDERDAMDIECETDLKEIAHYYGGWNKLREVIDMLEDNENEAAYERWSSDYDAPDSKELAHRQHESQKIK